MRELEEDIRGEEGTRRPGAPVDPGRLLRAVLPRWKWLVGAGVLGLVFGLLVAKIFVPAIYEARAVVSWAPEDAWWHAQRGLATPSALRTILAFPETSESIRARAGTEMSPQALQESIDVFADPGSESVLAIQARAEAPELAATLATSAVNVLTEHHQKLYVRQQQKEVDKLERDVDLARARLSNVRRAYDEFREQNGVSDVSAETEVAIRSAADLRAQADEARAQAEAEQARARKLEGLASREESMVIQAEQRSSPTAAMLAELRSELASAKSRLTDDHPKVQALQARIATLREHASSSGSDVRSSVTMGPNARLAEIESILSDARTQREAALERQRRYQAYAQQAEERLRKLSAVEGTAALLLSDIHVAENRLNMLERELVNARDDVRSPSSPFQMVKEAEAPELPARSKRAMVVLGFPVATIALALLLLVASALRGLRVHTGSEAGFWGNAPVVASSTWPHEPGALGSLVVELGDYVSLGVGSTLIVGATRREAPLAQEVAYWLSALTRQKDQPSATPEQEAVPALPTNNRPLTGSVPTLRQRSFGGLPPEPMPAASGTALQPSANDDPMARHWATRADGTGDVLASSGAPHAATVAVQPGRVIKAWEGASAGPELRRAARLADRVLVVISSNTLSIAEVAQFRTRLGRRQGVGLLMVGLDPELAELPDQVGEVSEFWRAARSHVA